ncbi:MAG: FG-GAP repeat protein [Trueperaceae bacterium]|nr:FG-GAP repeat protein [Trueperaceae bacterium]
MRTPLSVTVTPASLTLSRVGPRIEADETTFTVTNTGARRVTARAALEPLGGAEPGWLSLRGEAQHDFAPNATHAFTVRVAPPPDAPAGRHAFRLNVVDVHHSDEGEVEGPEVAFEVPPAPTEDGPTMPPMAVDGDRGGRAARRCGGARRRVLAVRVGQRGAEPGRRRERRAPCRAKRPRCPSPSATKIRAPSPSRSAPATTPSWRRTTSRWPARARTACCASPPARFGVGRAVLTAIGGADAEGLEGSTSFEVEVRRPFDVQLPALSASDGSEGSFYGTSVALDGDHAVVGASFDGGVAEAAGAAYLYRLDDGVWTEWRSSPRAMQTSWTTSA